MGTTAGLLPISLTEAAGLRTAWLCARASLLSYADEELDAAELEMLGFDLVARHRVASNFVIALDVGGTRLVAFRGTDGWSDIPTDVSFSFLGTRTPWGRVHKGFYGAAVSLHETVEPLIQDAKATGRTLWLTGHSLGGAIAALTAARLSFLGLAEPSGVVTFGQPPVGGDPFARQLKATLGERYWRFVNCVDAVAAVPGFLEAHAGRLAYFDVAGALTEGLTYSRKLRDAILAPFHRASTGKPLTNLTAHGMREYIALIEARLAAVDPSRSTTGAW